MLLLGEIGPFGRTITKVAEWAEGFEIGGFHKTKVVWSDAKDVVHENPFVLSDNLVHRWSLASAFLIVYLLWLILIASVDVVADSHLDTPRVLLRTVSHAVASVGHRNDVGVKNLNVLIGILEEQFRLCDKFCELIVGVCVVEFRLALSRSTNGEIHHQFTFLGVEDCLGSPCAPQFTKSCREGLIDTENGEIATLLSSGDGGYEKCAIAKEPASFHGTGDLWASAFIGACMRGMPAMDAMNLASRFVKEAIHITDGPVETEPMVYGLVTANR